MNTGIKETFSADNIKKAFILANRTAKGMKPIFQAYVGVCDLVIKASESESFRASITIGLANIASVIESEFIKTVANHRNDFIGDLDYINRKIQESEEAMYDFEFESEEHQYNP